MSVAATFVALEFCARIFEIPGAEEVPQLVVDEELGWVRAPNQGSFMVQRNFLVPSLFKVRWRTNSRGMRDREYALEKNGKLRILALGDSETEGWGVEENQSYPNVLEDHFLNDVEVWNMGVAGYGTDMELLQIQRVISSYHPDLVLLAFNENDLFPNVNSSTPWLAFTKPLLTVKGDALVVANAEALRLQKQKAVQEEQSVYGRIKRAAKYSAVCRLFNFSLRRALYLYRSRSQGPRPGGLWLADNPYRVPESAYVSRAWKMTERILQEIDGLCRSHNTLFVLTYTPRALEIIPGVLEQEQRSIGLTEPISNFDVTRPERILAEMARRNGIHFVEMGPSFRAFSPPNKLYLPNILLDGHLSAEGQRLVAQTLSRHLLDHSLLPPQSFREPRAAASASP